MSVVEHTKLVSWRQAAGLTQAQAAAKVVVTQSTWCEWEHGTRKPSLGLAIKVELLSDGAVPIELFGFGVDDIKNAHRLLARRQRRAREAAVEAP